MDSRTAASVLSQIAAFLELQGANRFKFRAFATAARAVQGLDTDDLEPLLRSGALAATAGIGPAILSVLRELIETEESSYLERLRAETPDGLLEMMRVPGLAAAKIHQIHRELGITTVAELEAAARDGRLAALHRFGPKTAEKILNGIAFLRATGTKRLFMHAAAEAHRLRSGVASHPDVEQAEIAGSVRRALEVARDVDIVAACRSDPAAVVASFTRLPGVRSSTMTGDTSATIVFVDGTRLDLHCVAPRRFAMALWRATGSDAHVDAVRARLASRGFSIVDDMLHVADSVSTQGEVAVADEAALYELAGLAFVPPELRENLGEVEAAAAGDLPRLVDYGDLRGVLHCHSTYSDGTASIADMAAAARSLGWSYLGISDHSESAFYAAGVSRDRVAIQHDEIDRLNRQLAPFRILKGVEADILADGRLDYGDDFLERFDYVIGSVHSRHGMNETAMTERVLTALDSPHLTILGHPTGRLLLAREPYAIDITAVIEKARDVGVAVELNVDPRRLDLDWRHLRTAKAAGATVAIGPDAHSIRALAYTELGMGMAQKGWLTASDVLNARSTDEVIEFARARRVARGGRR